jgi:hypothetical protein
MRQSITGSAGLLLGWLALMLMVTHQPLMVFTVAATAAATATTCSPPLPPGRPAAKWCERLDDLCVDQGVFVHYSTTANPRTVEFESVPQITLHGNITANLYAFGDQWGTDRPYPNPLHRPATSGEESRELAHPVFSRCTVPLVVFPTHLYRHYEFFLRTVVTLHAMLVRGWYDRR